MSEELTETKSNFVKGLILGIPAAVLWLIGALGALSLLAGISNGSVTPGQDSTVDIVFLWRGVIFCTLCGILLAIASIYRRIPT